MNGKILNIELAMKDYNNYIYKIIKVIFFNITGQIKDYLLSELKFGKRYEEILDFSQGKAEGSGE